MPSAAPITAPDPARHLDGQALNFAALRSPTTLALPLRRPAGMNEPGGQSGRDDTSRPAPQPAAVDAALSAGDVTAALRVWHDTYAASIGGSSWQRLAEAAEAYLRIVRASGSPAAGISHARNLYLSTLFRASSAGSLEGILWTASAFSELGDDGIVTHALRIARRLAGEHAGLELRDRIATLKIGGQSVVAPGLPRSAARSA
jgi:hypothetical protein